MEYAINEDDIHLEVDCVKKLFNFSEQKVSNAEKNYMECTTVDATIRERSLKLFADKLIEKVKDNSAYKLTDLKVVLGSFKPKKNVT